MAHRSHVDGHSTIEWLLGPDVQERPAAILIEKFDPGMARRQYAAPLASHLAMLGRPAAVCVSLIAGLLATVALIAFPDHAAAQAACSVQNNAYICNLPAGSYSTPQGFDQAASSVGSIQGMGVTSYGDIGLTSSTPSTDPLHFYGLGATASGTSGVGGDIYGVTVDNQGSIAFQPDTTTSLSTYVFGIYAYQSAAGAGSSLAGVNVTNTATIDMNLSTVTAPGGAGIWATDQGGNSDGGSNGAWVTNSGAITVALAGSEGFAGIQAISPGGGNSGSGNGGTGGETSIVNSAAVDVTWIWQGAGSQNNGVHGLQALSQGGNGGSNDEGGGGTGGGAGAATVTLNAGGDVSVAVSGTPPTGSANSAGVLAAVIGGSGGSGAGAEFYSGGGGAGISGAAQISVTDANVTTTGDLLPGLSAIMQAGNGGDGGCQDTDCSEGESYGSENGGYGGQVVGDGAITVTAATQPVTISTTGADSAAVQMLLMGGEAGNGGTDTTDFGGTSGGGGGGGAVTGTATVTIGATGQNLVGLTTQGDTSPGIYVLSQGGNGGLGGDVSTDLAHVTAGGGGAGGAAGTISVTLASTSVATQGASSPGVYALSQGGTGAVGGFAQGGAGGTDSGAGGAGGDAGAVTVTLDSASTISTRGDDATGILAQSFSGAGGNAGGANGGGTHGAGGGTGGAAGSVTVTNGGAIVTGGDTARGILAQSMAGAGGGGGFASGLSGHGGTGGSAGAVGAVTVTHDGSISTMGSNAQGVLLQSIGGSGGAGGQASGTFSSVGGSADDTPFTADGNTVSFTSNGGIVGTSGMAAFGVLSQSIGGGGGDGGGSSGGNVVVGGNGGAGGDGGAVQAQFNAGSQITTVGDAAAGIVMQSIGGGGGNAGNASADAMFVSDAVGGKAGGGGAGGTVTVNADGAEIVTAGSKATGILAQSIGGGGGTGGWAFSYAAGPGVAITSAVGGAGGGGGDGGTASVTLAGSSVTTGLEVLLLAGGVALDGSACSSLPCNMLPVDSFGAVVQSIGGGGGNGGSATAQSLAIAVPVDPDGDQVSVSFSVGVGGNGGTAGDGKLAEFFLTQGSTITTYGQGSTGVLAQSIGGGGGNGGDSSALAAAIGYDAPGDATSLTINGAFTVGGDGGAAGAGGEVLVALGGTLDINGNFTADTAGSAPTSIATYGDYANGVTAQSIGGGGGNAGIGAGNTQSFGTGSSTALAVTLGSTGAAGGAGGQVYTFVGPGNGIATYGSGALGVLAQSVGGGGGTSQGGSVSVAQSFSVEGGPTVKPGVTVNLGADATGTGGAGGNVNVDVAAAITTHGGDAVGVLAQSVGGGGGLGGSSGSDGSADNPIVPNNGLAAREGTSEVAQFLQNFFQDGDNTIPSIDPTFTVTLGGAGAQGGAGGDVEVALSAAIITTGDWASGIIAQSVGGGGGKGGSAAASGTGGIPEVTINANLALAGNGGAGGDGGEALVDLQQGDTAVHTAGYGAAGIVVQSVGGGGGIGADGSDSATGLISLGTAIDGSGGGDGDGGPVTLSWGNTNGTTVVTTGDAADGVILQSVGGGGGIGGAGSSVFGGVSQLSTNWSLSAGGAGGASGDGGNVLLQADDDETGSNVLNISTQGAYSVGLLAQSIGGGGGLISVQPSAETVAANLGGTLSTGGGGSVQLTATQVNISTQGIAAAGIVAQSIGGGGGYIRVADTTSAAAAAPALTTAWNGSGSNTQAGGFSAGGLVNVHTDDSSSVTTTGAGSVGVLAQSIGGGGGALVSGGSISAGGAASAGASCEFFCYSGGGVAVDAHGDISATGANSIGIFAQSQGYGTNGAISVSVHGTVTGGSGTAATSTQPGASGIQIDGGNSSNEVTVETTGTLTTAMGTSGTAVVQTGSSFTNLWNYGTTIGSTYLNGGTVTGNAPGSSVASAAAGGAFENYGTYHAGAVVDAVHLANHGTVNLGMPGEIRATHVTGDFIQSGSGQLGVTIDSLNQTASHIHIDGTASVDGVVAPTAITLLPGSVPVLTAGNLISSADALDSLVFDWDAAQSNNTLTLTARPDFTPDGVSLTASQASLANYHSQAWNNADAAFAGHFGYLSQITEAEKYAAALDEYSSKDIQAQSIALANSAGTILGSSMSCPVFVGQQVRLDEDNCAWLDVSGRWSDQDATGDIQGYSVSGVSYRIGAQQEIAPDWHLGGSFAYGQTSATMDGGSSGDGDTFDGSVSLTHIMDSWFFAGSVALAHGSFEVDRRVNLPGISGPLESDPSIFLAGGRLRAGYQFAFGDLYLRPYGDLDVIYTHLPGVQESGSSPYALDLSSSSETNVALSAMVEFGGRVDLDANTTLRPYAAFGVSYLPDNTRTIEVSAANQASANGTFSDHLEAPEVLGRVDLGLQLYSASGFEVKAGYTADIGDSFLSQSASARIGFHF